MLEILILSGQVYIQLFQLVAELLFYQHRTASAANIFASFEFYVNPAYQAELDISIARATDAVTKKTLTAMRDVGSGDSESTTR